MKITVEEFQEAFPVFSKGPDSLTQEVLSYARHARVEIDSMIYREGDPCAGIGFLLSGEIRVFKIGEKGREITLYEIYPGETCILNASCLMSHKPYPANAMAITDLELLMIPDEVFLKLIARHDEMRNFVFALFINRLSMIIELVEEIAFGKLDTRLMDYLVEKAENAQLLTTHQNIANELGTSREVISRLLKELERSGEIILSRKMIRLVDQ